MICYYFPPLSDVGGKRSVAFARYFRKHGWRPHVLSVRNPDRTFCTMGTEAPPDGVPTRYCRSLVNVSWILGKMNGALSRVLGLFGIETTRNYFHDMLCYPDRFVGWVPMAVWTGARMVRQDGVDVIYVSCSPFSSALVGILLKRITGRPLVLDFRDPFVSGVGTHFEKSRLRRRILGRFERRFVEGADLLLVTSNEARTEYVKAYPSIAPKTFTVYNGIDAAAVPDKPLSKFEKFTIIYTGEFYTFGPHHERYTALYFGALAHLKRQGVITSENFQFLFYGHQKELIEHTAASYGVADLVAARGRVPYAHVLEHVSRSHLMLLRIVKLMISTKLYEGIPLNVPFLAVIPHGEVEDLIRRYSPGSYVITEEGSHLDVAAALEDAMARYRRGDMPANRIDEFLARFTREQQTLEVMRLVEDRLAAGGSAR